MTRHQAPGSPWPRPATALRETLAEGYTPAAFRRELLAGAVVGIVALPLSMALAIASGVPPAHGLYTAIVAGGLIPLLGGSRLQVSGPTAAFVVILAPISHRFGTGGLVLATLMAGALLFAIRSYLKRLAPKWVDLSVQTKQLDPASPWVGEEWVSGPWALAAGLKTKNAQEAHEAVRPTSVLRKPEAVKPFLTHDQARLYELIWKRTVACQMTPAQFDTIAADITVGEGTFRATGQTLAFAGFLAVYQDDEDDKGESKLPALAEGETLPVDRLYGEQHFTQPPPRYTEASLVKTLEEYGIRRP